MPDFIQNVDVNLLVNFRDHQISIVHLIAECISALAWKGALWWIITIILWFKKKRQLAFDLALCLGLVTVIGLVLKDVVNRARPELYTSLHNELPLTELISSHHSFPSGHTILAAGFTFIVFFYYRDYRFWGLFIFTILVALSRMYLGVHWPSDVLASLILGLVSAMVVVKLLRPFLLRITFIRRLVMVDVGQKSTRSNRKPT